MEAIKQAIMERIEQLGGSVSFAELATIDGFHGDFMIGNEQYNVWWWFCVSAAAIDAISALAIEGKIKLKPCDPMVYLIDGRVPTYPVAKRVQRYKSPHWLPVVVNPVR